MAHRGNLVIVGISVGLALGIFIASLVFFGLRWYKKRAHLRRCANERCTTTLPIHMNGEVTSIDSSVSPSNSGKGSNYLSKSSQHSWWSPQSKDRFASASGIPRYSYKDIQKATQNFTTILGQGSFGPVYKATMAIGGVVAVKVLASNSKQGEKEFQTEVSLLGRLHHRNLVNLVGYCVDKGQHMLIYEFMSNGSLKRLLYSQEERVLSWEERLQIALDISHGIEYLHDGSPLYRRLWGPGRQLEYIYPHANPRGNYNAAPVVQANGFVFVRIRGGFHEIRNSICDVVVISRLLNATLVIPEIQSTTSSKGISSEFKSFAYLYDEDQFIAALAKDVTIVKTLPKNLKGARRKKEIPMFRVPYSASPYFYLRHVLPVLNKHSVVELVISDGGCLQAILPHHLEEYQRLRCRVSFHALRFRQEVQELATKILNRLRAPGRPFIAYYPGMTRDALAYYGCAELFQDVHTELIQHRRSWMIKRGIVKGKLSVNSAEQRLNGSCPLMPEEVGILLRAYGYSWDTIIYVSGGEIFGGQKKLIPLHGMFENVVDRTSLSTAWELSGIYGHEANLVDKYPRTRSFVKEETRLEAWKTSGPRPRPLPPPPARPKYPYNIEGWWGWVAESDNEPESTVMELRMTAHKLLWEAIDYTICVEADVFVPGFDRDGKGRPNFASLVMGHRLYQSAASKTYRLDRREVVKLLEEIRDHLYQANHTWITSVRKHLRKTLLEGLKDESTSSKPLSFLSHPLPECSCLRYGTTETSFQASSPSTQLQVEAALGVTHRCPAWMDGDSISQSREKETEEDLDEDDSTSSGLFFWHSVGNHGGGEVNNKEETQMEDQEELEGADR